MNNLTTQQAIEIVKATNCTRVAITTYDKDIVDYVKAAIIESFEEQAKCQANESAK